MQLRRASDGVILADEFTNFSGWNYDYQFVNIPTVTGVYYPQATGVLNETYLLTAAFANDLPNSTNAKYRQLVQAHRGRKRMRFKDETGDIVECRVFDITNRQENQRWEPVRTKLIRMVEITLLKIEYHA